jgi:hypothetical protein
MFDKVGHLLKCVIQRSVVSPIGAEAANRSRVCVCVYFLTARQCLRNCHELETRRIMLPFTEKRLAAR